MTLAMLDELMAARFSCRAYLETPVAREVIEIAIRTAGQVPSWCNAQPWQVIACDMDATARLRDDLFARAAKGGDAPDVAFPDRYEGVYQERRRRCGWQLYEAVGVKKGDRVASARQMFENFRLFGAPNFLLITTPRALGAYGVLDCGAFVTALTLALQAQGVASIPMASVAGFSSFLRERFEIDDNRDVVCGIACGYANPDHPANGFRTERAALDEVVRWEQGF